MKVAYLFSVWIPVDLADFAVVHSLRAIFGMPGDFIDEVAEMQDESDLSASGARSSSKIILR
jgi:hypothetical protein